MSKREKAVDEITSDRSSHHWGEIKGEREDET